MLVTVFTFMTLLLRLRPESTFSDDGQFLSRVSSVGWVGGASKMVCELASICVLVTEQAIECLFIVVEEILSCMCH